MTEQTGILSRSFAKRNSYNVTLLLVVSLGGWSKSTREILFWGFHPKRVIGSRCRGIHMSGKSQRAFGVFVDDRCILSVVSENRSISPNPNVWRRNAESQIWGDESEKFRNDRLLQPGASERPLHRK